MGVYRRGGDQPQSGAHGHLLDATAFVQNHLAQQLRGEILGAEAAGARGGYRVTESRGGVPGIEYRTVHRDIGDSRRDSTRCNHDS